MAQANIIKKSLYLGNKLNSLKKKFDVYLKLHYKRRELGCDLDILSLRYNLKTNSFFNFWMHSFIITHSENNEGQFLEDFAQIFIITDNLLQRVGLHHEYRFQNRLFQDNVDES